MKKIGNKQVLEVLLADLAKDSRAEGECTVQEILDDLHASGVKMSRRTLIDRLNAQCAQGRMTVRKWKNNGHIVNLYSAV